MERINLTGMYKFFIILLLILSILSCKHQLQDTNNEDFFYSQIKLKEKYKNIIKSFIEQGYPDRDSIVYTVSICQGYRKTRLTISYLKDIERLEESRHLALLRIDSNWVVICDGLAELTEPDTVYQKKIINLLKDRVENYRGPIVFDPKMWVCEIEGDSILVNKRPNFGYDACPPTMIKFIPPKK